MLYQPEDPSKPWLVVIVMSFALVAATCTDSSDNAVFGDGNPTAHLDQQGEAPAEVDAQADDRDFVEDIPPGIALAPCDPTNPDDCFVFWKDPDVEHRYWSQRPSGGLKYVYTEDCSGPDCIWTTCQLRQVEQNRPDSPDECFEWRPDPDFPHRYLGNRTPPGGLTFISHMECTGPDCFWETCRDRQEERACEGWYPDPDDPHLLRYGPLDGSNPSLAVIVTCASTSEKEEWWPEVRTPDPDGIIGNNSQGDPYEGAYYNKLIGYERGIVEYESGNYIEHPKFDTSHTVKVFDSWLTSGSVEHDWQFQWIVTAKKLPPYSILTTGDIIEIGIVGNVTGGEKHDNFVGYSVSVQSSGFLVRTDPEATPINTEAALGNIGGRIFESASKKVFLEVPPVGSSSETMSISLVVGAHGRLVEWGWDKC